MSTARPRAYALHLQSHGKKVLQRSADNICFIERCLFCPSLTFPCWFPYAAIIISRASIDRRSFQCRSLQVVEGPLAE